MSGLTLDDAKEAAQDARSGNLRENDAGIPEDQRFDYENNDAPIGKGHPECLVTFDRIVDFTVFNTDDDFLTKAQNLEGAGPQGYGNQVILTVENPTLVEGQLWNEDHGFRDFRVLGDPNSDASPYSLDTEIIGDPSDPDGVETNGVTLGMGGFDGEQVEDGEFDAQFVQFLISARRASDILGALDTAGEGSHTQDGEFVEGIIEYHPLMGTDAYDSDTHGAPRAIGYPELRADMIDQAGAISWTFRDDEPTEQSPVEVNVYKLVEGEDGPELEGLASLRPDDEAYALPTYPRGGNVYWDHDDGGQTEEGVDADATPDTQGGMAQAQSMMADETTDELAFEDLGEEGQAFVEQSVELVAKMDDEYESVTDIDDWDEFHATNTIDEPINATKEDLESIIDERL